MPAYPDDSSDISGALTPLTSEKSVSTVATSLLDLFTSGSISPGTRLPPERELAKVLAVGRSAVREALAALEILGVVDVRPGSGTYLRGSTSELLPQSLRWGILIGERSTEELIEVRGALEIYAARLAAERMSEMSVSRLAEHLAAMESSLHNMGAFVEADLRFHLELAEATANAVLLDTLQIIRSLLRVWADRAVQDSEQAEVALREHARVYDAIRARDGDAAASAMAGHMTTAARRLKAASSS